VTLRSSFVPRILAAAAFCAAAVASLLPSRSAEILFTGALDGNLDGCECFGYPTAGLVKLAAEVRERDRGRTILLDAGDALEAGADGPLAEELAGAFRDLGYDAVNVGDQDFSAGAAFLAALPFASANLAWDGRPAAGGARLLLRGGLRVAVIPVAGPESFALFPEEFRSRLGVEDPAAAVAAALARFAAAPDGPADFAAVLYHGTGDEASRALEAAERAGVSAAAFVAHEGLVLPEAPGGRLDKLSLIDLPRSRRVERLPRSARVFSPGLGGNRLGSITVSRPVFSLPGFPRPARISRASYRVLNYRNDPDDLAVRERVLRYDAAFTAATGIETELQVSMGGGGGAPIELDYYFSPNCGSCIDFLNGTLPAAAAAAGRSVKVRKRNIMREAEYESLTAALAARGLGFSGVPVLIGPGGILQGEESITGGLADLLAGRSAGTGTPPTDISRAVSPPSLLPVLAAGLLDGVNPCAFSTVVFLLSSLALAGAKGRRLAGIGLAFCAGVFAAYFAVGLGAFAALRSGLLGAGFSRVLRWTFAALLCLGAGASLLDARRAARGRSADMLLQLPLSAKRRIHDLVRGYRNGPAAAAGAFLLGSAVSVLELGCTGQVYLPTLVYLSRSRGAFSDFALLAAYNLAFIAPLLAVFALASRGLASRAIGAFFSRRLWTVKAATAALFLLLAVAMVR
jgi:cytochrome c biogenesis protein CcdA